MGANNSSPDKADNRHRRRSKDPSAPTVGQDVVRGQKITIPDSEKSENRLSINMNISDSDREVEEDLIFDNNLQLLGTESKHSQISVHTDIPSARRISDAQRTEQAASTDSTVSQDLDKERDKTPITTRARNSIPDASLNNMQTIRNAKVNVRDKVSFLEDTKAPVLPDRRSKPPVYRTQNPAQLQGAGGSQVNTRAVSHMGDFSRSDVIVEKLNKPDSEQNGHEWTTHQQRRTSEPAVITSKQQKKSSTTPNILETAEEWSASHQGEPAYPEYTSGGRGNAEERDGGWSKLGRMDTLEYFKHIPRDNSILKGFEKAKPAARTKKDFGRPRGARAGLPRNGQRPVTMYSSAADCYSSNPYLLNGDSRVDSMDAMDYSTQPGETSLENLASINNKTGQRYAMDDTAYETISRRKKIAGQRLPIGIVDKQTESKFLKSLKRNLQLRQARNESGSSGSEGGGSTSRLDDMMF